MCRLTILMTSFLKRLIIIICHTAQNEVKRNYLRQNLTIKVCAITVIYFAPLLNHKVIKYLQTNTQNYITSNFNKIEQSTNTLGHFLTQKWVVLINLVHVFVTRSAVLVA